MKPSSTENKAGSPAPSSNVPPAAAATAQEARAYLVATAAELELAGALVSFLPPAREDGLEGVTIASVSRRPEWCAPPTITANVCVCLLHLLDGEHSSRIANQVCGLSSCRYSASASSENTPFGLK